MKKRQFLKVVLSALAGFVAGCVGGGSSAPTVPEDAEVPSYKVASETDIGDAATVHIERKVVVPSVGDLSDEGLRLVALDNVAEITDSEVVDAVTIFFYEEGGDIQGAASGRVEWAPFGDIGRRDEVPAGNYDEYEFSVERF